VLSLQAAEMMRSMPPEQIAEMSRLSGAPAMDPASLAEMQSAMASMSPDQMETMMRMSANMTGGSPADVMKDPAAAAKMAEVRDSSRQQLPRVPCAPCNLVTMCCKMHVSKQYTGAVCGPHHG